MCRYNFRFATPGMVAEFGFSTFQITGMLSAVVARLRHRTADQRPADRSHRRQNARCSSAPPARSRSTSSSASRRSAGTFSTFAAIWLMNGYVQSFGAPGMIKMNAAWFRRTERGTFAGIFGFMIQLGPIRDQQSRAGHSRGLHRRRLGRCEKRLALALPHSAAHRRGRLDPARDLR